MGHPRRQKLRRRAESANGGSFATNSPAGIAATGERIRLDSPQPHYCHTSTALFSSSKLKRVDERVFGEGIPDGAANGASTLSVHDPGSWNAGHCRVVQVAIELFQCLVNA